LIRAEITERIRAAKKDASDKRFTARLLFKGFARKANCFAINFALGQTIRAIYRHADQQYKDLAQQTRQLSWLDWLQAKAADGRGDALQALRRARRSAPMPKTLTPANQSHDRSPAPRGAQVTKQGAIIETVAGYAIRRDEAGIYLDDHDRAPDQAVIAMLQHATNMFGSTVKTHGRESFQLRLARVAGLIGWQTMSSVEEGLKATLRLVVDPALEKVTGKYFDGLSPAKANAQAYDRKVRQRLAALSRELVSLE
jgi:hypothetical protein